MTKGKPKDSLPKASLPKGIRKPWGRLTWTETKKEPWRAYICGSHNPDALTKDCQLIVETTKSRSLRYKEILEEIYKKLHEENYTKEEALQLRAELEGQM